MTATLNLGAVLHDAERFIYSQDTDRDRQQRRERVQELARCGWTTPQIAIHLGLSDRQVTRLRSAEPLPVLPHSPNPVDITTQQADRMETLAEFAINLACRLRAEDPAVVWAALNQLDLRETRELAVVLMALIPVDAPLNDLLDWVYDLPAAREES